MAELKTAEMVKTAKSGNYSGKTRDQIFELKINSANNNTFIIGATESGKKVIGIKYDIDKQGKRWFTYVLPHHKTKKNLANNQITVSSLRVFKSPDFGGGARGSGTNDKAGSILNLLRWVSPRTIKETFVPPTDYRYPFLGK